MDVASSGHSTSRNTSNISRPLISTSDIFRPRQRRPLFMMANTMQTLPKFLLPRLSWSAPVGQHFARASVATTQASSQRSWQPPARSLHTERATSKALSTITPRSLVSPFQKPELRRAFHASAPRRRDHHFDTLKFVQRLQSEGFTEEQSVAIMKVLNDVIQERSVQSSLAGHPMNWERLRAMVQVYWSG